MTDDRYAALVGELETYSQAHPRRYQLQVAALAALGFGLMLLVLGLAGAGLLALLGVGLALLLNGGKFLLLLIKAGKLLILLALPLWFLIKASMQALFVKFPKPEGIELTPAQAPALFEAVQQMRQRLRGPAVHHVLITDEVNAAVVQRPALGLFGWPRNYLLLGLPLLEHMSPEEALAVVAHEYGHLAGAHGRFGAWIYRLRLSWATLQGVASQWEGAMGRLLQRLVGAYAPYFNAYTHVLARANEYAADQASADLVGAAAAARALKRVNLVAPQHEAFLENQFARVREQQQPPADLSQRWAAQPAPAEQEARQWLDQALRRQPQLHDTHPALAQRLQALRAAGPDELPPLALPHSAAQRWLAGALPSLRERMAREWQGRLEGPWQERHQALREQAEELEQLRALAHPDREQWLRRLRACSRRWKRASMPWPPTRTSTARIRKTWSACSAKARPGWRPETSRGSTCWSG
ncbi:MAG: M48 family metallopeptidase [Inhella sp.]